MKLHLPSVTLVLTETRLHKLAALAVHDCLNQVKFGDVVLASNLFEPFGYSGRHLKVPDWDNKTDMQQFMYCGYGDHIIRTTHTMHIEWDSGIIDPEMWDDEFLKYDYIGAPWNHSDMYNVGNGGFSMRSQKLNQHLYENQDKYKFNTKSTADDTLCRCYRPFLETEGFKWPNDHLAHYFSYERAIVSPTMRHFGYHGVFNWGFAYGDGDRLNQRMETCNHYPYIKDTGMWQELCDILRLSFNEPTEELQRFIGPSRSQRAKGAAETPVNKEA